MTTQSYRLMTAEPNASKPLGCSNELTQHVPGLEWLRLAVMSRYASVTMRSACHTSQRSVEPLSTVRVRWVVMGVT